MAPESLSLPRQSAALALSTNQRVGIAWHGLIDSESGIARASVSVWRCTAAPSSNASCEQVPGHVKTSQSISVGSENEFGHGLIQCLEAAAFGLSDSPCGGAILASEVTILSRTELHRELAVVERTELIASNSRYMAVLVLQNGAGRKAIFCSNYLSVDTRGPVSASVSDILILDSSVQAELIREASLSLPNSADGLGTVAFGDSQSAILAMLNRNASSVPGRHFTAPDLLSPAPTVSISASGIATV